MGNEHKCLIQALVHVRDYVCGYCAWSSRLSDVCVCVCAQAYIHVP